MAEASAPNSKTFERICETCQTSYPDIESYIEHLESKRHIKNTYKAKYGEKYLEAKANLESNKNESGNSSKDLDDDVEDITTEEDDDIYTCDTCKKVCTGWITYNLHLQGKKHKKNVQRINLIKKYHMPEKEKTSEENTDLFDLPEDFECEICNVTISGAAQYKQHINGKNHRKFLLTRELISNREESKELFGHISYKDDIKIVRCETCDKSFSGLKSLQQHLKSPVHAKQQETIKHLSKIQDLYVSCDENRTLKCKECDKSFTGPLPFEAHLATHEKAKKKKDILDALQEEHPEMLRTKNKNPLSPVSELIACDICHTAFSGPESAQDHFKSLKHLKVKQKMEELKQYKQLKKSQREKKNDSDDEDTKYKLPKKTGRKKENDSDDDYDIIPSP